MQLLDDYIDAYISTLKYLDEVVSEPAAEYGLSFEQYLIMHAIAESYDDITLTDIVEKRKVTRAAISRQIKMLMKKEYVYQETDCHDRRRQILRLTNEGKVVCEVVNPLVKGDKVIVFKMKRRKDFRVRNGHREQFTEVEIKSVIA